MNRLPAKVSQHRNEQGFATMCVVIMAMVVFVVLGGALHVNYCLHEWNRKQAEDIQKRAEQLNPLQQTGAPGAAQSSGTRE